MTKQILLIGLLTELLGNWGCHNNRSGDTSQHQSNKDMTVTTETLKQILDAFNRMTLTP